MTQKVDCNDPILGFFHSWIMELSKFFEKITVICLEKGEYSLPSHIEVLSLGKEKHASKLEYISNFYSFLWRYRKEYDHVLVHMNEEYVLMGGVFWHFLGKKLFMWRNHAKGSLWTKLAVLLSQRVFCTSPTAFVTYSPKTHLMPVGVETKKFFTSEIQSKKNSFLVLGRIDPVKKVENVLQAVSSLQKGGIETKVNIVGNPSKGNQNYFSLLKNIVEKEKLSGDVSFSPAVKHSETPLLYHSYSYYINLTPSGSLDKTIFEALASGLIVITANNFFKNILPDELIVSDPSKLENAMKFALDYIPSEDARGKIKKLIEGHSLENLGKRLSQEILL